MIGKVIVIKETILLNIYLCILLPNKKGRLNNKTVQLSIKLTHLECIFIDTNNNLISLT